MRPETPDERSPSGSSVPSHASEPPAILGKDDLAYFERGRFENPRFWARLGDRPDFAGAFVVDLGCGHGSLCVDIASSGAGRVIGLDLSRRRIDFANENVKANYPDLAGTLEFRLQDLREMPEAEVDYFVSKDAFEHVTDLAEVLDAMRDRLRPGGRVYAGFGPLWYSPFGDHGRTRIFVPWAHAVLPRRWVVAWHNRVASPRITSIEELGLNGFGVADYARIFADSGLVTVSLRVNASERLISRVFSSLGRLPGLREYVSHNLYCILEKPAS